MGVGGRRSAGEGVLSPFGVIDAAVLSQDGCLDLLARLACDPEPFRLATQDAQTPDRHAAAQRAVGKDYVREEIALALRWSVAVTGDRMRVAQDLRYRPPRDLTNFVMARDQTCTRPKTTSRTDDPPPF